MEDDPYDLHPSEQERGDWLPPITDALDDVLDAEMLVCVRAAEKLQRIDWYRRDAIARAARRGIGRDLAERSARLELACGLRIGEQTARMLLARAEALIHRYPAAFQALSGARITPKHADLLTLMLDEVPDPGLRERLVDPAVRLAEQEPVGTFTRKLKKLIEKEQAPTLTERHRVAMAHRHVWVEDAVDGMAWTHLYGPAVDAHAAYDRATAIGKSIRKAEAKAGVAGPRSLDQLRADVYGDLLVTGVVKAHPRAAQRIRAQVVVTVPALSLLSDEHATAPGAEAAVVEGVGPIPIETARELAADGKEWMRVLTHPETGMVLSVGRDRYKVPKSMRRIIAWRASRCLTPGCGMPAHRCEIDHRVEWHEGGETSIINTNPLCKGHHIIKTLTDWRIDQTDGGGVRWTSPTGRTYTVEPERKLPAFTIPPPEDPPPF